MQAFKGSTLELGPTKRSSITVHSHVVIVKRGSRHGLDWEGMHVLFGGVSSVIVMNRHEQNRWTYQAKEGYIGGNLRCDRVKEDKTWNTMRVTLRKVNRSLYERS